MPQATRIDRSQARTPDRSRTEQAVPRLGRPPHRGILVLAIAALLVMTMLGPVMVYSELPLAGEGNPLRQAVYAGIFLLTVYGVRPRDEPKRLLAVPIAMAVAVAWCWLSTAWAIDPGITVRRMALTTVVIWTIFVAVDQLGYQVTVNMLRVALLATLVINFAVVLLLPQFGIHQINAIDDKDLIGDWRGFMMHKNFAGAVSALLVPFFVFDARRIPIWLRVAAIAGAIVFLIYSHSKTSLGLVGVGVAAGYVYYAYSPRYRVVLVPAFLLVATVAVLLLNSYRDPIHAVLRDPTAFTGRSTIWRSLLGYVDGHATLGAGYGSFWNIGPSSPIYTYAKGWVTQVTSAHNGFLDLVIQIGVPGLVLVLIATVVWPLVKLLAADRIPGPRAALAVAVILFCVSHNGTESSLFDRDTIVQVFLTFAIALVATLARESARAQAGSLRWLSGERRGATA